MNESVLWNIPTRVVSSSLAYKADGRIVNTLLPYSAGLAIHHCEEKKSVLDLELVNDLFTGDSTQGSNSIHTTGIPVIESDFPEHKAQ